jgi:hypothetical protein
LDPNFEFYPYPRIDFGTGRTIAVTYPQPTMPGIPPTTWGNRIQIPLFEAGVAIVLNVGGAN